MIFENSLNNAFWPDYTTLYAFLCTVILCFLFQILIFRKIARENRVKLSFFHYLGVGVFLVYLLFVYRVTGMGTIWDIGRYDSLIRWHQIHLIPFHNLQYDLPFTLLNIIMTIPLGFLLPSIWPEFRKLSKVAFTGLCLSVSIELSQLLNHRGTSVEDLLMNTLGAILGYLIFAILYKLFHPLTKLEVKYKSSSSIITNEGVFYIIFSFLGMFLLFNP
jgi:glycopeptide antibiotics resistance protein